MIVPILHHTVICANFPTVGSIIFFSYPFNRARFFLLPSLRQPPCVCLHGDSPAWWCPSRPPGWASQTSRCPGAPPESVPAAGSCGAVGKAAHVNVNESPPHTRLHIWSTGKSLSRCVWRVFPQSKRSSWLPAHSHTLSSSGFQSPAESTRSPLRPWGRSPQSRTRWRWGRRPSAASWMRLSPVACQQSPLAPAHSWGRRPLSGPGWRVINIKGHLNWPTPSFQLTKNLNFKCVFHRHAKLYEQMTQARPLLCCVIKYGWGPIDNPVKANGQKSSFACGGVSEEVLVS